VPMPEWNKEALQAFIGLDMNAQRAQKTAFLRDTLPQWKAQAAQRQPGPDPHVPSAVLRNGPGGGN
jgi:formate-dependent nitrite reductase cytochrome c552 subunit